MKQYRLIKIYPSCQAKLGQIIEKNGPYYQNKLLENHVFKFKQEIENNPEFWEEIVDYPVGTRLIDTGKANTWKNIKKTEKGWTTAQLSQIPLYIRNEEIGEGKRFKVVKENDFYPCTEDGIVITNDNILLFEVILDTLHLNEKIPYIAYNNINDKKNNGYASVIFSTKEAALDFINKNKVILTTEDKVDIKKNNFT